MKTLIIYDESGYVLDETIGQPSPREPVGVPFLWVDIPENKYVVSVDTSVSPHQVILEDVAPTEVDLLKAQNTELMLAVAELGISNAQTTAETQLALAELATLVNGGNE